MKRLFIAAALAVVPMLAQSTPPACPIPGSQVRGNVSYYIGESPAEGNTPSYTFLFIGTQNSATRIYRIVIRYRVPGVSGPVSYSLAVARSSNERCTGTALPVPKSSITSTVVEEFGDPISSQEFAQ